MPHFVRKRAASVRQANPASPQSRMETRPATTASAPSAPDALDAPCAPFAPVTHAPVALESVPVDAPIRINKALADAGLCSRRKAEDLVTQGLVRVNGELVTSLSHKVFPDRDTITVNNIPLKTNAPRSHILLHKPVQVVCTVSDPQGRTTILDLLPPHLRAARLYPIGRLDYFSEGLLLLTDDGELAQRLAHPRFHLQKVYEVVVRGAVPETALTTMRRGMTLAEGEKLAPVGVKVLPRLPRFPQDTVLQMTLRQGLNRQIRRMCRDVGLTILRLRRVAQGPLALGDLPVGKARPLTDAELAALRAAVGDDTL